MFKVVNKFDLETQTLKRRTTLPVLPYLVLNSGYTVKYSPLPPLTCPNLDTRRTTEHIQK